MAPLPSSFSMANGPSCWPISMMQPVSAWPLEGDHDTPHGSTGRIPAGNCTIVRPAVRGWQPDSSGQGPTNEFDLHAPPLRPGGLLDDPHQRFLPPAAHLRTDRDPRGRD